MSDPITVRGFVATSPHLNTLPSGAPATNFRLASTPRWYDAAQNVWREASTNWFTVNAYRNLAQHTAQSLFVGQPVIVTGRLNIKQWESSDGRKGTTAEIDATAIGHDLNLGSSSFNRAVQTGGSNERPDLGSEGQQNHQKQSASAPITFRDSATTDESKGDSVSDSDLKEIEDHANADDSELDPEFGGQSSSQAPF